MNIINGSFVAGGLEYFRKPDFVPVVISQTPLNSNDKLRKSVLQAIADVTFKPEPISLVQKIIYPIEKISRYLLAAATISLLAPVGAIVNLARSILLIGKVAFCYVQKEIHPLIASDIDNSGDKKLQELTSQVSTVFGNTLIDAGVSFAILAPLTIMMRIIIGSCFTVGASEWNAKMDPTFSFFTSLGLSNLSQQQSNEFKKVYTELADLKWTYFKNDDSLDCPRYGYDATTFSLPFNCNYHLLQPFFKALPNENAGIIKVREKNFEGEYESVNNDNFVKWGFTEYGINQLNLRKLIDAFNHVPWNNLDAGTRIVMTRWKLLALTVYISEGYSIADSKSRDCRDSPRWLLHWVQNSLYRQMAQQSL
ncbi:MAG: hypothetical protein H0U49_08105 [Parachlamydiaceae bacterium]|nr:hypothetical protein [Parachlamydiaceae bacterium]